jgi:hypothetical protein
MRIWDNTGAPNGSNAFLLREGSRLHLGFSPGPWGTDENETLLQANWYGFGNPANNIQIPGRLITGSPTNTDLSGELNLSFAQSASYAFAGSYTIHPECTVTPQFDLGPGNRYWVTYTGSSAFQVNFASSVSGSVSYTCIGRN